MAYYIDKHLLEGIDLMETGDKANYKKALRLISKSARRGETRGKSFFTLGCILREGLCDVEANLDESKRYFDAGMQILSEETCDSMDYRMMGDYYNYGLGTEAMDKKRALEYYDQAALEGDELAKKRANEIRETENSITSL